MSKTKPKQEQKIEQIKTSELIPYAKNAKKHSAEQISQIAGSIREFGFNNPVLVDENNPPGIIAGHGRVLAAQQLNMETVPCIRLGHLNETQKRAYILADNRLAETGGGWDLELLKVELDELRIEDVDLDALGFGEDFRAEPPNFEPGTEDDQGKLDELEPKWVKCSDCGKVFDSRKHEHNL